MIAIVVSRFADQPEVGLPDQIVEICKVDEIRLEIAADQGEVPT